MSSSLVLAETMYAAWRAKLDDPTSVPAWGNLPSWDRVPWDAAARLAETSVTEANAAILGNVAMDVLGSDIEAERVRADGIAWSAQYLRKTVR